MELSLRSAAAALLALGLLACDEQTLSPDSGVTRVQLHGNGLAGERCKSQSECGFRQHCVHRGNDIMSESLVVEAGLCEPIAHPGGCFALLPQGRLSVAETAEELRKGKIGLPVQVVCE